MRSYLETFMNRRQMLKLSAAAGSAVFLAACGAPVTPVAPQKAKPLQKNEAAFFNNLAEFEQNFGSNQMWTILFMAYMVHLRDNGGFDVGKYIKDDIEFHNSVYSVEEIGKQGILKPLKRKPFLPASLVDWPRDSMPSCDEIFEALFWKIARSQPTTISQLVIDETYDPGHELFNIYRMVDDKRWFKSMKINQALDYIDQNCQDRYKVKWNYQVTQDGFTTIAVERLPYDLANKYGGLTPEKRLPALITSGIMVMAASQPGFAPVLVFVAP